MRLATVNVVVQNGARFSTIIWRLEPSKPFLCHTTLWADLFVRLCRVYMLLNAKHGINEADKFMLRDLDAKIQSGSTRWTLQAIITKADLVPLHRDATVSRIKQTIFEQAPTCLPPIVTASLKSTSTALGVNDLRMSIVEACALALR
jgi:GTP-binding protein EngB required for normal cell division